MNEYKSFMLNEEKRQHINLSKHAMATIKADMVKFNDDYEMSNRSGFINIIVKNYFEDFPLSRNQALKQLKGIQRAIDKANEKTSNKESFHSKLSNVIIAEFNNEIMRNLIEEYSDKYSSQEQFKLKLNKENAGLLMGVEDAYYFNKYAPRNAGISFFIKIILESYATLTREQREKIFYKETIEQCQSAIDHRFYIKYKNDNKYIKAIPITIFKPKVRQSLQILLAVNTEGSTDLSVFQTTIKQLSQSDLRVTKEKFKNIEYTPTLQKLFEDIETQSAYPEEVFTVKFTSGGLHRFIYEEDRLSIIGIQDPNDQNIYTFKTTETQMFFHLFKFGSQAQILSPVDARERFMKLYKASYEAYERNIE